jgi:hypothetical protein
MHFVACLPACLPARCCSACSGARRHGATPPWRCTNDGSNSSSLRRCRSSHGSRGAAASSAAAARLPAAAAAATAAAGWSCWHDDAAGCGYADAAWRAPRSTHGYGTTSRWVG